MDVLGVIVVVVFVGIGVCFAVMDAVEDERCCWGVTAHVRWRFFCCVGRGHCFLLRNRVPCAVGVDEGKA